MFARFHISNLVTYLGMFFAVLATYFCFSKMAYSDVCYVRYALVCLVVSGICDMFDGKFARLFNRSDEDKEFGVQLDSLSDTFCFLGVPIIFLFSLGMTNIITVIVSFIFLVCGVSRLGYYNIKTADKETAITTYRGLPVTSTAISFPLLGLLHPYVDPDLFCYLYLVTLFLTAMLMVIDIRIPKFKKPAYIIVPILAVLLIILLLIIR